MSPRVVWGAAALVSCALVAACGDGGAHEAFPDALADVLVCGDATGAAACDDHNSCTTDRVVSQVACNTVCAHDRMANCCGNGVVEAGEACDDGNQAYFDGCSSRCEFERALVIQTCALVVPSEGCDLNGDGRIDNAASAALNDQARSFLGDFLTRRSFQGNPVVALLTLVGPDEQMMSGSWTAFFLGGADIDGNPMNNFSGNEPFLVVSDTLDPLGRPRWAVTGRAPAGNLVTDLGTLTIPLPNRAVLENEEFA